MLLLKIRHSRVTSFVLLKITSSSTREETPAGQYTRGTRVTSAGQYTRGPRYWARRVDAAWGPRIAWKWCQRAGLTLLLTSIKGVFT